MRNIEGYLEEEAIRLASCIKEPIRTPAAIQPHGVLVSVDKISFTIIHVSESSATLLGVAGDEVLGKPLEALVGDDHASVLRAVTFDGDGPAESIVLAAGPGGATFDVIVTDEGDHVLIEFEPTLTQPDVASVPALYGAMRRLNRASTRQQLWDNTAKELHDLLGFDRVMVYHFHPDEHGEVVAEERVEQMEPYKGLHYPASDIPAQARELYLTKLSRVIADSSVASSALLSATAEPLDLTCAELRSVSPHHLEFMHNMGQASTFSLSLIRHGRLIGMITCAHRTPRRLPFDVRKTLELLADQVAMQLGAMADIVRLEEQAHFRVVRDQLVERFRASGDMGDALFQGEVSVSDLIHADGVALCVSGELTTMGDVPSMVTLRHFAAAVLAEQAGATFVKDALPAENPGLAAMIPTVAGVIVAPIGSSGDFIIWFRNEVAQSVDWLGDLSKSNRATTLSPRTSFSAWTQSVTGKAIPWDGIEAQATQLARELERAIASRNEARLAVYAMHDVLTGLPNRRLFMDRLEQALGKSAHVEDVSLLFLDLDGFKAVNDSLGHEAGDKLLIEAATRIRAATRAQDTVARLGGDEFVVLCEKTTAEDAEVIAERINATLRKPIELGETSVSVTASVGMVSANSSFTAAELLRDADAAMYRAKVNGRDRASH
jgi:diguanylate cyclase (GGDEF)-like protein